jgi:hypothetical protein
MGKAVKGRNEPTTVTKVAWIMHKVQTLALEELTEQTYKNSVSLFKLDEPLALNIKPGAGSSGGVPIVQPLPAKLSNLEEWPSLT